jgi:hypothetical protein
MSVAVTVPFTLRPLPDSPPLHQQRYYPSYKWSFQGTDTGDATGGNVQIKSVPEHNLYYVVTNLYFNTNEVTASQFLELFIDPSEWEEFSDFGSSYLAIYIGNVIGSGVLHTVTVQDVLKPIYIGKPIRGSTPHMVVQYTTNTDTKLYDAKVTGYAYLQPPLLYHVPKN